MIMTFRAFATRAKKNMLTLNLKCRLSLKIDERLQENRNGEQDRKKSDS